MIKKFKKKPRSRGLAGTLPSTPGWGLSSSLVRPSSAGLVVDEVASLNLASVWRAVNVKAGDIAKLPLTVNERLASGGRRPNRSHRVYELLAYPNEFSTGRKLRHTAAVHLILWGNCYVEIIRDEDGEPVRLELLDPRWVKPRRDEQGRLSYWLCGTKSPWSGRTSLLPPNVLHFSGLSLNGDAGLHTVRTLADPIATALALDKFAGGLWGNGAQPGGMIEVPAEWGDDARKNFRESFFAEHGGVLKSHRIGILEEGAKFVPSDLDPEKLQVVASREFSVVEVARIVGIPPHKLFDMSHDVERTLEEANRSYYDDEIEPIVLAMADEMDLKLLTVAERRRFYVAFDMTGVMRGTALERAQINDIKMRNGVLTANEWRAEEGYNPFDEDIRLTPLNMQAIPNDQDLDPDPAGDAPADPEPLA